MNKGALTRCISQTGFYTALETKCNKTFSHWECKMYRIYYVQCFIGGDTAIGIATRLRAGIYVPAAARDFCLQKPIPAVGSTQHAVSGFFPGGHATGE
jgi:hypothetical protein